MAALSQAASAADRLHNAVPQQRDCVLFSGTTTGYATDTYLDLHSAEQSSIALLTRAS
jgi:hypothetical protein